MPARNGSAEWHGNIQDGAGTVTIGNGIFQGAYSYGSRFGEEEGTNPEQLDGAPTLARIDLDVDGQVANVDLQQFRAYADAAPVAEAGGHLRHDPNS